MARTGLAYQASGYTRTAVDTAQAITMNRNTTAVLLAATSQTVFVTFDGTTPTATNGIPIIAGAQPVLIPLAGSLSGIGAAAGGFLHVQQIA